MANPQWTLRVLLRARPEILLFQGLPPREDRGFVDMCLTFVATELTVQACLKQQFANQGSGYRSIRFTKVCAGNIVLTAAFFISSCDKNGVSDGV